MTEIVLSKIYEVPKKESSIAGHGTLVTYGDSITEATNVSVNYTDRLGMFLNVVATKNGYGGTPMQATDRDGQGGRSNNGLWRHGQLLGANRKDVAVIMYGTNDLGQNYNNWNHTLFKQDYQTVLTNMVADGYQPNQIVLCSPPWIEDYNHSQTFTGGNLTEHMLHVEAVRDLAKTNGCLYANTFTAIKDNGGSSLLYDGLHPNDEGHLYLAIAVASAVSL